MAGKFPQKQVEALLVECHRRCCVCHRFCGVKIETDHIDPSGGDAIANAIPVCFECHAEIHSYNPAHPRGRKFHRSELQQHKKQWLEICRSKPEILLRVTRSSDVGPIQALVDELEFNCVVARMSSAGQHGCLFQDAQFRRAISEGSIAMLLEPLKEAVLEAYAAVGRANELIRGIYVHAPGSSPRGGAVNLATDGIDEAKARVERAHDELIQFLGT